MPASAGPAPISIANTATVAIKRLFIASSPKMFLCRETIGTLYERKRMSNENP
jgi:hypothetical protein